jgi:hypothetical protein
MVWTGLGSSPRLRNGLPWTAVGLLAWDHYSPEVQRLSPGGSPALEVCCFAVDCLPPIHIFGSAKGRASGAYSFFMIHRGGSV